MLLVPCIQKVGHVELGLRPINETNDESRVQFINSFNIVYSLRLSLQISVCYHVS